MTSALETDSAAAPPSEGDCAAAPASERPAEGAGAEGRAPGPARAPEAGAGRDGEPAGAAREEVHKIERLAGLFRQSRETAARGGAYRPNRGRTLERPPGLARLDQFEEIVGEGRAEEDNVSCKLCGRRYHKDYIHNHMAIVH